MSMLEQSPERLAKVRESLPCYGCSRVHPYGTLCADRAPADADPLPPVPTFPTATADVRAIKMPAPYQAPSFQESRAHLDREIKRFEVAAALEALRSMRDTIDREIRKLEAGV